MNAERIRRDFPFLQRARCTYLDSACTTLKPRAVLDAMNDYYCDWASCPRSAHRWARHVGEAVEDARRGVARFVRARDEDVVWTKNTTEAINLVARSLDFSKRRTVVTSNLEHHSALLPFLQLQNEGKVDVRVVRAGPDGTFGPGAWAEAIDEKTRLVVVHHTTNTTGMRAPLGEITKAARGKGALVLVDGAQGVPHAPIDFRRLGADFLAFSSHKMLGPTGVGCLVARAERLSELSPFLLGGDTVKRVSLGAGRGAFELLEPPHAFEAGIQNYAGIVGLGAAVEYLEKIGMRNVEAHEQKLARALVETLAGIPGVRVLGNADAERCALASFTVEGKTPKQVAGFLDEKARVAVRGGFLCAEPAVRALGAPDGAVRASAYAYNTLGEIALLGEALNKLVS